MSSILKVDTIQDANGNAIISSDGSGNLTPNTFTALTVSGDLTVDTNTLYVDSTNNRVGIGTTSPTRNLHLVSGASTNLELERTAVGSESKLVLSSATSFNAIYSRDGASSDKDLVIHTGSTERMSIKGTTVVVNDSSNDIDFRVESNNNTHALFVDGGNDKIGIINSSPQEALDVGGKIRTNNNLVLTGGSAGTNTDLNKVSFLETTYTNQETASIKFGRESNAHDGRIIFATQTTSGAGTVDRMMINSNGLVGIGTTSPQKTLHIVGPDGSAGAIEGNSNTALYIDNNDSVLVNIQSGTGTTDYGAISFSDAEAQNQGLIYYNHPTNEFTFHTEGSNAAVQRLSLSSTAAVFNEYSNDTDFRIESNNNTHALYVDGGNDRVGINVSSPATQLDVGISSSTQFSSSSDQRATNVFTVRNQSETQYTFAGIGLYAGGGTGADWTIANVRQGNYEGDLVFKTRTGSTGWGEKLRIKRDGNVGIGTISPTYPLSISSSYKGIQINDGTSTLTIESNTAGQWINGVSGNNKWNVYTNGLQRLVVDGSGNVLFGKTAESPTTNGFQYRGDNDEVAITRTSNPPLIINRLTDDGTLVVFRQANTDEGSISVSGATVSYNGFTGTHWSRLSNNSKPTILKGTILESLDEMMDWYQVQFDITDDEGNTRTEKQSYTLGDGESVGDVITYNFEGTDYQATIIQEGDVKHTKSKISDTVDAKNVYGVFMDWDNDDDTVNDMYVAQTGTFVVRMNSAETVSKGDLIQSNGDGTGKVQADDIIRASTVAKILSTTKIETYDDGSYIVPCSLHC